jgi:anti-anti-sigma factor
VLPDDRLTTRAPRLNASPHTCAGPLGLPLQAGLSEAAGPGDDRAAEPEASHLAPIAGGSQDPIVKWQIEETPEATVIRLQGEVDLGNADQLVAVLDAALARGAHIVLDLADLTYIDTTGWHVVVNCDTRARQRGRRLLLCALPRTIRKVFKIIGLEALIPAPASVADALALIREGLQ